MSDLDVSDEKCAGCGQTAEGFARIGRLRYCHSDTRDCFRKANFAQPSGNFSDALGSFVDQSKRVAKLERQVDELKAENVRLRARAMAWDEFEGLINDELGYGATINDVREYLESRGFAVIRPAAAS